jgi:5-formyltetrahydrofolate cyclo-ligase
MIRKSEIRAIMLARRRNLSVAEQASLGKLIQSAFLEIDAYRRARTIALYLPVNGEVPTDEVVKNALSAGKKIFLPVINGDHVFLRQFLHFDKLEPGKYGILEPVAGSLTASPLHMDIFVVPGVMFDLAGNRGGYGKGYYDRLLRFSGGDSNLVGFCYDFQLVDAIEVEPHDIRMDMVITERRVITAH